MKEILAWVVLILLIEGVFSPVACLVAAWRFAYLMAQQELAEHKERK